MALGATLLARSQLAWIRIRRLRASIAALVGLVIICLITVWPRAGTRPYALAFAIGTSLLTSALFALLAVSRDSFAHAITAFGITRVFLDRKADFTNQDWTGFISGTRRHYRVLGVANHGYIRPENEEDSRLALDAAVERGVDIEVLWLDPLSDIAAAREREEGSRETRRDAISSIEWFWTRRNRSEKSKKHLRLYTYKALPTSGITWKDNYLIITHYLVGSLNQNAPGLVLVEDGRFMRAALTLERTSDDRQLSEQYIANYKRLKDIATEIDETMVEKYIRERTELPQKKSEAELGLPGVASEPEGKEGK